MTAESEAPAPGAADLAAIEASVWQVKRQLAIVRARKSLITFTKLMMPDPEDPGNPDKSAYVDEAHHRMLAESVERAEDGSLLRFAQSIPPQHGKSLLLSRMGTAWKAGRNPRKHRIVGTYNSDFAREVGDHVRSIINDPVYAEIFPGVTVSASTKSKSDLGIMFNGRPAGSLRFRGRGEATTGLPCDDFTIDDPYKDKQEADSDLVRKECRDWYSSVVFTRIHRRSSITIVHTRWNEDDLIGGICDPDHPEFKPERARRWKYINVPAVIKDPGLAEALGLELSAPTDPVVVAAFGRRPMVALWAARFPLEHLAEAYENDPGIFSALYMGAPSPEDGIYFKAEWLAGYKPDELPKNLRIYGASDHALTSKQERDANCLGCVGVDEHDVIWVLPDLHWERGETDETVDAMLDQMRRRRPHTWWAARDHIAKSIGPFLRARMREEQIYCYIEESPETKDAKTRARGIQGRMSMGMVRFPVFAPWWPAMRNEILKFPNATHDDTVSWLSHIGMGLDRLAGAAKPKRGQGNVIKVGSAAWVRAASAAENRARERRKAIGGM